MTALRPERDSSPYGGEAAYGGADAFEAEAFQGAGEGLSDPLTDPLPGGRAAAEHRGPQDPREPQREWYGEDWQGQQYAESQAPYDARRARTAYERGSRPQPSYEPVPSSSHGPQAPSDDAYATEGLQHPEPDAGVVGSRPSPLDEATMSLRVEEVRRQSGVAEEALSQADTDSAPALGGRAARRKAAKRRGRYGGSAGAAHGARGDAEAAQATPRARHGAHGVHEGDTTDGTPLAAPRSRVEARRAARARRPGAGVIVSRVIGEVFITAGVLMLLFVTYQLWWSNIRAQQHAGREASSLQQEWASSGRAPGAFEPGQGFAILHIPKLDVVAPIAEGINKTKVLDRGMLGHYDANSIKTAMPEDKQGNFGIAGHRNTHGEPFRYIDRLEPGDPIVVETRDTYYVYEMASILRVTPPSNISVLDPIPKGSGFTKAGRYITLTTCTPEFTSKYRMIVWGKMVEERPRSEGKPDALVQ